MKKAILSSLISISMVLCFGVENVAQQNVFLNNDKIELKLFPDTELGRNALNTWTSSEKPRLTTEKLFEIKKADFEDEVTIEKVSKIIRSISTMKGTKYYSNRNKKIQTLYHDAYLVDSPKNKNKIKDDTQGSADGKILYCMQDDNSFGKCYYKLSYRQTEKEVSVCFDNFESLKFGFITAAKAHNIKINLVVTDNEDTLCVYLLVQAYYPKISILEEKMLDSFNARVDSIYEWFVNQLKNYSGE